MNKRKRKPPCVECKYAFRPAWHTGLDDSCNNEKMYSYSDVYGYRSRTLPAARKICKGKYFEERKKKFLPYAEYIGLP